MDSPRPGPIPSSAKHTSPVAPFAPQIQWSRAAHVARVKAAMLRAAESALDGAGFTQVLPSLLTGMSGACGDPGTLIAVELKGEQRYLRQTSQLHLEPMMRELGRVYSVSRSFRAERRLDERRLDEFTLIEAEALGHSLPQLMPLMEELVACMLRGAGAFAGRHLLALGTAPVGLVLGAPFPRMTYDDAIIALQKRGHFIEWGEDLADRHELVLAENGPLFVTHYPISTRFFTMKISRDDPRVVECCDLLLPGLGEVMGASETEPDADLLQSRLAQSPAARQQLDMGGSLEDYGWYIDMHRERSTQQAGFGMGFERLVRYACGLSTLAEAA